MNQKTKGVILTAAKADITVCEVFGDLPTGLIPVNGKPIVFFILQQMIENSIEEVYIGIDYKGKELQEIVNLYFNTKLNIHYVFTDKSKAPGNSLLTIFKEIKDGKVVVNLADTYIKNFKYNDFDNSILVSPDFLDEERWATAQIKDNKIISFSNKEKVQQNNNYAICGLYIFNEIELFNKLLVKNEFIQINDLLEFYKEKLSLQPYITDSWLDFGHIDKYYISKKRLIQSRGFNSLEYDDLLGTITKRSKNVDKFRSEISWQLDLPKNIKVLAPRVLDYSLDDEPFITMEFYSYPTLSEIWLFSDLNEKMYFSIIDKLFKVLELFSNNCQDVTSQNYKLVYIDKTIQRIESIQNQDILELLEKNEILINGKIFQNWTTIKSKIIKRVEKLYIKEHNCFIHGDFCLSNILYDLRSGIVRLIDPRGIWGENENGDIKYDVAKLRHSICGDYDYIVNDLFTVEKYDEALEYKTFNSNKENIKKYFDDQLSKFYEIEHIKLIEGLLFLSMIALHSDNKKRQLVMYAKAIELLNDSLYGTSV